MQEQFIRQMVGEQHVQRANEENVQLMNFVIQSLPPIETRAAYQVTTVAHSSENPNKQYSIRLGIVKGALVGFDLLPMPVYRRRAIARCSCAAADQGMHCKHVARALQYCIPGFNRLGPLTPGVPQEVHDTAKELEQRDVIKPTSSHQRARNHASSAYRAPPQFEQLLAYGYISPNYAWEVKGFKWVPSQGGFIMMPKGG
eukprot:11285815-Karenia_brevis.AAC.1